jgi:hypothetical protein
VKWFRDSRLNLFLSFWLLWSTVGIKVYLEYCSCAQDIHFNLFEVQNNSCSDGGDYIVNINHSKTGDIKTKSCCTAKAEVPECPPKGCDSQDVQEFKVHSPFIPSSSDRLSIEFDLDVFAAIHADAINERYTINPVYSLQLSDVYLSSLEYRVLIQSFLC